MKLLGWLLKGVAALFGLLLIGLGIVLPMHWAPDRPVALLQPRWAPAPSQFVEIDGLSVHLRDEGPRFDPVPILLLHGTSASLHTWEGWVAQLRAERRLISVDLPGFGLTGPRPDGDYRIPAYVGFLHALLERLQVEKVALVGNSFGGELAWQYALAHPGRVERLVLVDAAGYPLAAKSIPLGWRLARMPLLGQVLRVVLPRQVVEASVRNTWGHPERVPAALVDRYYELTLRAGNRAALLQRFEQMRPGADVHRLGELQLPVLLLWGARDQLIPVEQGQQFQRAIPGSRLVIFDDLGHVPQEEQPERTLAAARAFLAGD